MRASLLFFVLLPVCAYSTNSDVATFNDAWRAYETATMADDTELLVDTAAAVVDAGKRIFPEDDERLTLVTRNYGVALSDDGNREDAVPVLEEALRLGEIVYGKDGVGLIPVLADLADAEARPFSPVKQRQNYAKALKIVGANFGKQSVEYADLAFRASRNVYLMSKSMDARKLMVEARDIYAALPQPATQNIGMANFYLGKMEFSKRDFRDSSEYLEYALASFNAPGDDNKVFRLLTRALLVQTYEHRGLTEQATEHCVEIGRESQLSPNQDYEPLFRLAPMYPVSMLRSGKSGHVDLEFMIDENGFVREPVVIARQVNGKDRDRSSDFDQAALDAVKRFRYAPKFEDGEAVSVSGVKTRISFRLER